MSRPRKQCNCSCPERGSRQTVYKPANRSLSELECVCLFHDELESMHLCDGLGMTQEEAGVSMGVSRGTVQRLLAEGRRKIASAIVSKNAISISRRGHD